MRKWWSWWKSRRRKACAEEEGMAPIVALAVETVWVMAEEVAMAEEAMVRHRRASKAQRLGVEAEAT